jgi:hypothetical protein
VLSLPAIIADAGDGPAKRFLEFFTASIRNPNTRAAYAQAVRVLVSVLFPLAPPISSPCSKRRIIELTPISTNNITLGCAPFFGPVEVGVLLDVRSHRNAITLGLDLRLKVAGRAELLRGLVAQ